MIRRFMLQLDQKTRWNFGWDLASGGFWGVFNGMLTPFFAVIGIRIGASNFAVGLIAAAPCAALLASIYWGTMTQDKPKLPYVVWPNVVGRALILAMAFVVTPWPYVALIIAFWLVVSIPSAPYSALMEKIYPAEYRGRLLAYVRLVCGLAQLVAVTVAGRLLDVYGYRLIFPIAAVFGVASSLVFARIKEPAIQPQAGGTRQRPSMADQARGLLEDRAFLWWEIGFMLFGVGNLFLAPIYPIFQVKYLGLSNAQVGIYSTVWTMAWLLSYPIWGSFVDRNGPGKAIIISVGLFTACGLSYYLGRTYLAVLMAAAFNGVAEAAIDIGWLSECMKLARGRVSVYSGMHLTLLGIRGIVGPLLGASLVPVVGLLPGLLVGSLTVLAGIVPMLMAYKHEAAGVRRSEAEGAAMSAG